MCMCVLLLLICCSLINSLSAVSDEWPTYNDTFISEEVLLKGEEHINCKKFACDQCLIGMPLLGKYRRMRDSDCIVDYQKWHRDLNGRLVQMRSLSSSRRT